MSEFLEPPSDLLSFQIRDAIALDVPFILATWKNRMRRVGERAYLTNSVYFHHEGGRIQKILMRTGVRVTCLCSQEDPNHLYGYVVHEMIGEAFVIHFAYVKQVYQGMGLMTLAIKRIYPRFMLEEVAITHIVPELVHKTLRYRLKFNPYL